MTGPEDSSALRGVVLSVDVEEWFHAPQHPLGRDATRWADLPATLPEGVERALDLLDEMEVKATFFVLEWAAARYPFLIRAIVERGHEPASHGCRHDPVAAMRPAAFREDVRRSRARIQDIAGVPVAGYRAPCWSMPRSDWPYRILAEEGYAYSSSRLAVPGKGAGEWTARTASGVREIPALTSASRLAPIPAGGTVALRAAPLSLLRAVRRRAERGGRPCVYWFHPWELVPEGPRLDAGRLFTLVRYFALERLPRRLQALVPPGDRTFRRLLA